MADDSSQAELPEDASPISRERLREVLFYNQSSGDFVWMLKTSRSTRVGYQAGCQTSAGYLVIRVDGVLYGAHQLAWLYVYGVWPVRGIDHEDTVEHHNWIGNLRLATPSENMRNQPVQVRNKTGHKNIVLEGKKYVVYVNLNRKTHYRGRFTKLEDAIAERDRALAELHGVFARVA